MNRILKTPSIWINELLYQIVFNIHKIYYKIFLKDIKISIYPIKDTINKIINFIINNKSAVYIRFGDAEANIINGRKVAGRHQEYNKKLQNELIESLFLNGNNVIKSVMLHSNKYGFEKNMVDGVFLLKDSYADKIFIKIYKYFIGSIIYSPIAIHYSSIFYRNEFLQLINLIKSNYSIFVGNDLIKNDVIKSFNIDNYITTPGLNSYSVADIIEYKILDLLKEHHNIPYIIIMFSTGTLSNVLIKRLYHRLSNKNVFLFDIGSIVEIFNYKKSRWSWMKIKDKSYWDKLILDIKNI